MKNKGFTLVELLSVIALLAILVLIVAPNVLNNINDSRIKAMITQENQIADASAILVKDYCEYPMNDSYKEKCDELLKKSNIEEDKKTNYTEKYICLKDIKEKKYYDDELKFNNTLCDGVVVYRYNKENNALISKKTYVVCGEDYSSEEIEKGSIDINNYPGCDTDTNKFYPTKYKYIVYHDNDKGKVVEDCIYDEVGSNGIKDGCILSSAYKIKNNNYIKEEYVFTKWNTESDGKGKSIAEGNEINVLDFKRYNNERIHLYAQWEEERIKYTTLINSYKCSNITVGTAPYILTYAGACEIISDGNENWKVKLLGDNSTRSGTHNLILTRKAEIDVFLVGGGNGGGNASGTDDGCRRESGSGGNGGAVKTVKGLNIEKNTNYPIVIGAGGLYSGNKAGDVTTAFNNTSAGGSIASGGRGGYAGYSGYGYKYGTTESAPGATGFIEFGESSGTRYGGGGGGAGADAACNGMGSAVVYGSYGGSGGGGQGHWAGGYEDANGIGITATSGKANTGGGGGGGHYFASGKDGGSGIVIIRNAR